MKDETPDLCRGLRWGVPASLILHALLIALLVHGLPRASPQPQDEPAINVALVPPPERSKPQPAPQNPEAEKPPEPKVEKQPVAERPQQKPAPVEVLKPVFQFGDTDSGPWESPVGSGA